MSPTVAPLALTIAAFAACSSAAPASPNDAGHDGTHDAPVDAFLGARDARVDRGISHDTGASFDARHEASFDAEDAALPTVALIRLANWSPDAPALDFCVAPHGSSLWTGPVLASALGQTSLGSLIVTNAGLPVDSGAPPPMDAGRPADAGGDGGRMADASSDVTEAGSKDASAGGDAMDEAGPTSGVPFPRVSPYVSLTPGEYDVRVVSAGAECTSPLFPDVKDLPPLRAGSVDTFAAVGDAVDEGTDPSLGLAVLPDDTTVSPTNLALRFVNAVPSVIEVTFASGQVSLGSAMPYVTAAQFGNAGADTDAGPLDSNDYLVTSGIPSQVWTLVDANGGTATLVTVKSSGLSAGRLTTVVGIGGESGDSQYDIGILACTDTPPIVAGETASCDLLEEASLPVLPLGD